jgi:hypothetical protein
MADDISLAMTLRLRANANACDRAADRNRRALEKNRLNPAPDPVFAPGPDPDADRKDAEVIARAAAVRRRAEALQAHPAADCPVDPPPTAAPAATPDLSVVASTAATAATRTPAAATPVPATRAPATPAPTAIPAPTAAADADLSERQIQRLWGAAMTVVANEYAADLANLPPAERDAARARSNALSKAAEDLMSGKVPPRPGLGDLGAATPQSRL